MITLDVEKLRRLWFSDMVSDDIAKELGLTRHQLSTRSIAEVLGNGVRRFKDCLRGRNE